MQQQQQQQDKDEFMDMATNMNNSTQSINSLSLQPQVTKLHQEQHCDFVVP